MSLFLNKEDGYFSLTTAGEVAVIILIAVLVILTAVISTRVKENKDQKKSPFSTKQLVFSAVALALGFVTSYIKIVNMPWGGSITLCSMLFVTMIGYWYGQGRSYSCIRLQSAAVRTGWRKLYFIPSAGMP